MTSGARLPDSTFCSSVHEDDQADLVLRELLVGEAQCPAALYAGMTTMTLVSGAAPYGRRWASGDGDAPPMTRREPSRLIAWRPAQPSIERPSAALAVP